MIAAPSRVGAAWARFHAALAAERPVPARLLAASDSASFAAACVDEAASLGLELSEAEVYAALSAARRAWLQRNVAPPATETPFSSLDAAPPPPDWLPVHLAPAAPGSGATDDSPVVDWADFASLRLTDPFFGQSANAALRPPARLLFRRRCTMDTLEAAFAGAAPELAPAGFVFHLSRCGSTLLAQVLAASPRHRVLSEAPPLDQLLAHDAALGLPRARRVARLRALVHACSRRRFPEERRLFIKWDAWHTLHLDLIREAFPDTPWIYLHRDPVEILVSQRRQRGHQFIPGMMGAAPFGIAPEELPALDFDTYAARVLGASAEAAVRAFDRPGSRGVAVDYRELSPERILALLREHFSLEDCTAEELAAMRAACARNAKNPTLDFEADGEAKRREADAPLRALAERWLGESRRRLDNL